MDQAWDRAHGPRPHTASVHVRELSWPGLHNPCPQSKDQGSHGGGQSLRPVEEHLAPAQLALAGDPRQLSVLQTRVDTRENSLGNFGVHLPNLSQLKLNGSRLGSLRDLGTALGRLQVLWLARCGLADLDGISAFPALKELYLSYNNVSDLSPLCLLEQLEVLDLEGNCVEGLGQLSYLQLCPRLAVLTLEGNPVCLRPAPGPTNQVPQGYNYRAEVVTLIPQLQVLDEVPATHTGPPTPRELDQDWLMVKQAIKESSALDSRLPGLGARPATPPRLGLPTSLETSPAKPRPPPTGPSEKRGRPHGPPIWRCGPALSLPETHPCVPSSWPLSLLVPGGPLPEDLLAQGPATEDDASNLTHGAGRVLCGNPTKGLQERRHRCQAWVRPEKPPSLRPEGLAAGASTPGPDPVDGRDRLASAGLRALREPRLRRPESREEGATAPWSPQGGPEEQEDEAGPEPRSRLLSLAPEPSRTLDYSLIPSPPKSLMPSDRGSSWGSTDLQFRGRRLRALGTLGSGLGQGLAAMTALRALEVASGPSPRARGCPGPKPAPDPAARPPASGACRT